MTVPSSVLSPKSPTTSNIDSLTDLASIQAELARITEEEALIDRQLEEALKDREDLEKNLDLLDLIKPQLGKLKNVSQDLYTTIASTAALSETISDKVRQLDLEQSRVKTTIQLVENIQELKQIVAGVDKAMAGNDFETAAQLIHKYLEFDQDVMESLFQDSTPVPTTASISLPEDINISLVSSTGPIPGSLSEIKAGESPVQKLKSAQQQLAKIAQDRFTTSVQGNNDDQIQRFFKIFPLIGQHDLGLELFSDYICQIISRSCHNHRKDGPTNSPTYYADLLTKLFEVIAAGIEQHTPNVDALYGAGRMLQVLQRLQKECDTQGGIILDSFSEERNIRRKLVDVSQWETSTPKPSVFRGGNNTAPVDSAMEIRELDLLLAEAAIMCQRSQLFERWFHSRAEAEAQKLPDKSLQRSDSRSKDGLIGVSILDQRIQELMGQFVVLEEYFVRKSIQKAMKIDEFEEGNLTSSCVDDVFYILKKSAARVLGTGDPDTLCAMINVFGRILELDYMTGFQKRLTASFPSFETQDSQIGYMIFCNNMDVSCEYVGKLTKELDWDAGRALGPLYTQNKEKIASCLSNLQDYTGPFRSMTKSAVAHLFTQTLAPQVDSLMQDASKDSKYILSEDEFALSEKQDLIVRRLTTGLSRLLELYQKTFTEGNYQVWMTLLLEEIVKDWEAKIMTTKFNMLGAIRLDKELRSISSFLSNLTTIPVRDALARLYQICMLLNLEKLSEIYEVWGSKVGTPAWRLNIAELRKILALRVEHNPDAIAKLRLS